jgi:GMP synthase (glutamine-hydrolysing)
MTRLLMMEGNTKDRRARAASLGVRSSSEIYTIAVHAHFPDIEVDVIYAADEGETIPHGRAYADYDGFIISGSSLHAYDTDFAVTNQIAVLREAAEAGLPILGSCWGLQIAAVAAGGAVGLSPNGREVGFARKITKTSAGEFHPLLIERDAVFDAPCIHYDEVTRLPEGATSLATNNHSDVQAAVIPLGNSEVWAVQYHPEFDLAQLAQLYTLYADDMIEQGFFADHDELATYSDKLAALATHPARADLAWQLGIDTDILNDAQRRAEIIAWINRAILGVYPHDSAEILG